jgi:ABC-2 type transport system ATP-binding protein
VGRRPTSARSEGRVPEGYLAIEARDVVKQFGDVSALDVFDIEVAAGHVHGLVGPNGAGKTTFLRILFGLVAPDSGSITLLGSEWKARASTIMEGLAGFVEEPRFYPYLSARRNLQLLAEMDGVQSAVVDEVLHLVRLTDRADRKVGGFSSGMRQRLGLGAALLRSPRLLLLDEPSVGLDPIGAREAQTLIKGVAAEGGTVLLSSHNMTELDGLCDSVTVMREGKAIWSGSMERLRSEAPAPTHRMWTNDDDGAMQLSAQPGIDVIPDPEGGHIVKADPDALDRYVVALGQSGIAVRRLELLMTPLESMFFDLTGTQEDDASAPPEPDEFRARKGGRWLRA